MANVSKTNHICQNILDMIYHRNSTNVFASLWNVASMCLSLYDELKFPFRLQAVLDIDCIGPCSPLNSRERKT